MYRPIKQLAVILWCRLSSWLGSCGVCKAVGWESLPDLSGRPQRHAVVGRTKNTVTCGGAWSHHESASENCDVLNRDDLYLI